MLYSKIPDVPFLFCGEKFFFPTRRVTVTVQYTYCDQILLNIYSTTMVEVSKALLGNIHDFVKIPMGICS